MFVQEEIDSLISQIESLTSTRPLFYMKFCKEKAYAEDVMNGLLYANTPEYFREQEIKTGIRGQGDKNELTLSFVADNLNAYYQETGAPVFTLSNATVKINYNDDKQIPLISFVGIPLREMKFIDADESHAEFEFPFSEKEFNEMQTTFGTYCVIISARELEDKIKQACDSAEVEYLFDSVKYVVNNSLEKMQAFQKGQKERFLYKDKDFSYQREYRMAFAIEIPEDHYIHIEKLSNAKIIETSQLRNLRFSIGYKSHNQGGLK